MGTTDIRGDGAGRGRDLPVMTLEVLTGEGRLTFASVLCPKERRARTIEECAPCVDGGGPVTDPGARDGFLACEARLPADPRDASRSWPDATPVTAVMTRAVLAVTGEVPLREARSRIVRHELEGLPVVDRSGRPVGLLGPAELLRAGEGGCVADAMSRRVIGVAETAPLSEVAALMATEGASLVPVLSREGRVVGLVTALDLVRWLADREGSGPRPLP